MTGHLQSLVGFSSLLSVICLLFALVGRAKNNRGDTFAQEVSSSFLQSLSSLLKLILVSVKMWGSLTIKFHRSEEKISLVFLKKYLL